MFNEWYLARAKFDSPTRQIDAFPAALTGIRKYKGCWYYAPTHDLDVCPQRGHTTSMWGFSLRPETCKKIFGHCPKEGELLCVKKTKSGWKATKIDLEFSE